MRKLSLSTIDAIDKLHSEEKQVLDFSYISDTDPSLHVYKRIVNAKGKSYPKSRRCIKQYCNKLTTSYCSCCKNNIDMQQKAQDTNENLGSNILKNNKLIDRGEGKT